MATIDWNELLLSQLIWHWDYQLRPRLAGLTDDEYFWEPVDNAWSVRPRGQARSTAPLGGGAMLMDFEIPEPDPVPVTTIAWQACHVVAGVFGLRNGRYFGGPEMDEDVADHPATAVAALAALDDGYARWVDGVRSLGVDGLAENCREPGFENDPMAALVLHIHREVIHHGAMISSLRDWYVWR